MMKNNKRTRPTAKLYIEKIANDYQFDKEHEGYLGFINIDPTDAVEVKGDDFRDIATQIAMSPRQFEKAFNAYGLTIESAHETELIIAEID
tara:strand:- start:559 stop:831 length:273 start_codon:yes stop_codon:yes gene_type:complete